MQYTKCESAIILRQFTGIFDVWNSLKSYIHVYKNVSLCSAYALLLSFLHYFTNPHPSGQNCQKNSLNECVFC